MSISAAVPKVRYWQAADGRWRFFLNDEQPSKGYRTKAACLGGIEARKRQWARSVPVECKTPG